MVQLCLGSANFGCNYGQDNKKINKNLLLKIITTAKKSKLLNIDTSFEYCNSHLILKKIIDKKTKINTKIFLKKNFNFRFVKKKINDFNKGSPSKIHSLLLHDQNDALKIEKIKLLKKLQLHKIVKKIGVSVYDLSVIKKALKLWTPDIVQIPVNPFNTEFVSKNFLKQLKKKNITIFARSIFLRGMLVRENKFMNNKLKKKFENWFKFCKSQSVPPVKACLDFCKSIKELDFLIIGVQNQEELKQIIKYFKQSNKINSNLIIREKYKKIDLRKI
jgi:aryl-alcohol dehydrogenase-like predicted oxidoreductase